MSKNKKSIQNWLDQLTAEGKELCIKWDGGGDSGWVYFEVDDEQVDNEYTDAIIDHMYTILDYGSWAGEFSANGEAKYYPETKSFEGTDYYSEDEGMLINSDIKIQVPKSLWFDSLFIECESNYDETPNVIARFVVKNGFLLDEHSAFCSNLEQKLSTEFEDAFSHFISHNTHYDFKGSADSWELQRSEAEEEGDMLVFTIHQINIQTMTTDDRSVVFELDDNTIKSIDKHLNSKTRVN